MGQRKPVSIIVNALVDFRIKGKLVAVGLRVRDLAWGVGGIGGAIERSLWNA